MSKPKSPMCYLCQPPREHAKGEPHQRSMTATIKRGKDVPNVASIIAQDYLQRVRAEYDPEDAVIRLAELEAKETARRRRKADSQKRWRDGAKKRKSQT